MGNRANIHVYDDVNEKGVYLYSHWGGRRWHAEAFKLLSNPIAQDRVNNAPYLTRILFQGLMIALDEGLSSTGFGVSSYPPDNQHPIMEINCSTQEVEYDGTILSLKDTEELLSESTRILEHYQDSI